MTGVSGIGLDNAVLNFCAAVYIPVKVSSSHEQAEAARVSRVAATSARWTWMMRNSSLLLV